MSAGTWSEDLLTGHGGSGSRYQRGCRCDLCRRANRDRVARRRQERFESRVMVAGRLYAVDAYTHGRPSTYSNWGCRCVPCTGAFAAHIQRYRSRGAA